MKKITFDKAISIRLGGWRKDFPGYLLEHSAHPGREFVIARDSYPTASGGFRVTGEWRLFDRESGLTLTSVTPPFGTRREAEEQAICALFSHSPAKLAEKIANRVMQRMTKILQEEV